MGYDRQVTDTHKRIMDVKLGYDDGGRYALIAVSGYTIGGADKFGTVFSIIDCDTGDEVDISPVVGAREVRAERQRWIGRVMHLNGREDEFAA